MSEQSSPTESTSSLAGELEQGVSTRSDSSMDSLGGESCDDLETMSVPDAVVKVSPSRQSKVIECVDGGPVQSEPLTLH